VIEFGTLRSTKEEVLEDDLKLGYGKVKKLKKVESTVNYTVYKYLNIMTVQRNEKK